jgi:M6 family metalloprotease-like protein
VFFLKQVYKPILQILRRVPAAVASALATLFVALAVAYPASAGATAFAGGSCQLSAVGAPKPNEGAIAHPRYLSGVGTLSAAVVFVDFSDDPAGAQSPAAIADQLVPAAQSWFSDASYGRLTLQVAVTQRWLRMPKPATSYTLSTLAGQRAYMADAVGAADQAGISLSGVQALYVVPSEGVPYTVSSAFSHPSGNGVKVPSTGQEIDAGVTFGDDVYTPLPAYGAHVLEQDTLHLLGLPDLYDPTATTDAGRYADVGGWDPMSYLVQTADPLAYNKALLGWLDPDQVRCVSALATRATLTPLETAGGLKALEIPTGPSTAYVVEDRQQIGADASLCDDGVLVYSVDARATSGSDPIVVRAAAPGSQAGCPPLSHAALDVGPGAVCRFSDPASGVTVELLARSGQDFDVAVRPADAADAGSPLCGASATDHAPLLTLRAHSPQHPLGIHVLRVTVSADQPCALSARAQLVLGGGRTHSLGTANATIAVAGSRVAVTIRLRAGALAALRHALTGHGPVRVRVRVSARGAGGAVGSASVFVRVAR